MKLATILNKNSNNLDIFRVIAACMVIYGHAYALTPEVGRSDLIGKFLVFDYSGSLAVKIFFFLSGLVVTNSLLEKRDPIQFAIARFFRIWPALLLTIVVSALVLGPIFSDLSPQEYFTRKETYSYIKDNATLRINYGLPGVFSENPYKGAVNGSLWTIPHEVGAYLVLFALFTIGIFKSRGLTIILFSCIIIDPLIGSKILLNWLPKDPEINMLAPCFSMGAIFAIHKKDIDIKIQSAAGMWILFYIFRNSTYNYYFFYISLFYSIIYISSIKLIVKLKPKSDISYGIYLWGFPIQQAMASSYSDMGVRFNQLSSVAICMALGLLSWHLIEKRSIGIGGNISRRFSTPASILT